MSTFTKPGSEIYIEDSETVFFAPLTSQNTYGLTITNATSVIGKKAVWCRDCEGALIDLTTDDVEALISMELHSIEHKWFEAYPPLTERGVKQTLWMFFDSLTPKMQVQEKARRNRMDQDLSNISEICALAEV